MVFQRGNVLLLTIPNSLLHKINKNWCSYKIVQNNPLSLSLSITITKFWFFKGVTRDTRSWCRGKSDRMESSCRIKYLITSSAPSTPRRIGEEGAESRTMRFTIVWKSARRIIISSYGRIPASLPQASWKLR